MSRVLIVDDDKAIAELVSDALEDEQIETVICHDGVKALEQIEVSTFDAILLDIMMPNLDGKEVCKQIRNKVTTPIIFVTAKSRTLDTLIGLELGADDYITKPFIVEELVARVKAHIRREQREIKNNVIKIGEIKLQKDSFEVYKNNQLIELTTREFQLLEYLMEHAGTVLTKEQIFDQVWNMSYGDIGTVAVNIRNLRTKIDSNEEYIKTIWGVGYKFVKELNQ